MLSPTWRNPCASLMRRNWRTAMRRTIMLLKPHPFEFAIEQSAAKAIEAQRHLRAALSEVRMQLPPSLRYAVDDICEIPVHVLFDPE